MKIRSPFRSWIAGLSRFYQPPSPQREAGMLAFYNERLEQIASEHNCWRMHNERDRDLAFRTAVAIAERLNELEADLDIVININKE